MKKIGKKLKEETKMDEKIKNLKLQLMITYGILKRNPELRNRLKKEIARLKTKERKLMIESKRRKTENGTTRNFEQKDRKQGINAGKREQKNGKATKPGNSIDLPNPRSRIRSLNTKEIIFNEGIYISSYIAINYKLGHCCVAVC